MMSYMFFAAMPLPRNGANGSEDLAAHTDQLTASLAAPLMHFPQRWQRHCTHTGSGYWGTRLEERGKHHLGYSRALTPKTA
jgi:hypothetical protein